MVSIMFPLTSPQGQQQQVEAPNPPPEPQRPYSHTGQVVPISRAQQGLLDNEQPRCRPLQLGKPLAQEQCHLFRTPAEIRESIYRKVFGPSLLHIDAVAIDGGVRLAHVRCFGGDSKDGWNGHEHGRRLWNFTKNLHTSKDPNDQLLALCLTCRLTYVY